MPQLKTVKHSAKQYVTITILLESSAIEIQQMVESIRKKCTMTISGSSPRSWLKVISIKPHPNQHSVKKLLTFTMTPHTPFHQSLTPLYSVGSPLCMILLHLFHLTNLLSDQNISSKFWATRNHLQLQALMVSRMAYWDICHQPITSSPTFLTR